MLRMTRITIWDGEGTPHVELSHSWPTKHRWNHDSVIREDFETSEGDCIHQVILAAVTVALKSMDCDNLF